MGNTKSAAGCQHPEEVISRPTVRQAAQNLLDALEGLLDGPEGVGFYGWENSQGAPAGDAVEDARQQLKQVLDKTRRPTTLTGADFDEDVFLAVWKSEAVQHAAQSMGWKGLAEAMWRAALSWPDSPGGSQS